MNGSEQVARARIQRSLLVAQMIKMEVSDKAAVSVAEAKVYYDQHPEAFRIQESFSVQSISMVPPAKATPAQMEEGRKRAAQALKQAQATKTYEQFGLLAEKISEDDYRVMMGDHRAVERAEAAAGNPAGVAGHAARRRQRHHPGGADAHHRAPERAHSWRSPEIRRSQG